MRRNGALVIASISTCQIAQAMHWSGHTDKSRYGFLYYFAKLVPLSVTFYERRKLGLRHFALGNARMMLSVSLALVTRLEFILGQAVPNIVNQINGLSGLRHRSLSIERRKQGGTLTQKSAYERPPANYNRQPKADIPDRRTFQAYCRGAYQCS
jgi:hypothetical protein